MAGLEGPNISILSDEFLKEVMKMPHKNLAVELVDWAVKEPVRAKLRIMIHNLLRRYKYPPDQQKGVVDTVIEAGRSASRKHGIMIRIECLQMQKFVFTYS